MQIIRIYNSLNKKTVSVHALIFLLMFIVESRRRSEPWRSACTILTTKSTKGMEKEGINFGAKKMVGGEGFEPPTLWV